MPDSFSVLRDKWRHWLGWYWGLCDFLLGFLCTWLCFLFSLAFLAAVRLLERALDGADGSLGTGALIVALLSAPFLVWNTWIRHRALNFQKEGHLTDRLAKAVEQLGAEKTVKKPVWDDEGEAKIQETTEPNLEVRIGGLLSLERIAQDSTAYDKGRDHVRVMEIVCAYIRNNAPASKAQSFLGGDPPDLIEEPNEAALNDYREMLKKRSDERREWLQTVTPPREDVALALRILGRRTAEQRRHEIRPSEKKSGSLQRLPDDAPPTLERPSRSAPVPMPEIAPFFLKLLDWKKRRISEREYWLDLRDICLQKAALDRLNLSGARLDGARLEGADLEHANLQMASLISANLTSANLNLGQFDGANFSRAILEDTQIHHASLVGADLSRVKLQYSQLLEANLQGTKLNGTQLDFSQAFNSSFQAAAFDGASVIQTEFYGARLESERWLNPIATIEVDQNVSSSNSVKRITVLESGSPISQAQIDTARGDTRTMLPNGLDRPSHWRD